MGPAKAGDNLAGVSGTPEAVKLFSWVLALPFFLIILVGATRLELMRWTDGSLRSRAR
ncbi:MAG: hypothetical protein ACOC5M_02350 [Chloroflexota bacterium]